MTCVAWDGHTLAADKAANSVGYQRTVTKVFALPDGGAVAFTGDGDHAMQLLDWFRKGKVEADYPDFQKEDPTTAWYVDKARRLWVYGKTPYAQPSQDEFDAGGSGRDYALAAMHLGYSARRAVEVAIALDTSCGKGVDAITFPE